MESDETQSILRKIEKNTRPSVKPTRVISTVEIVGSFIVIGIIFGLIAYAVSRPEPMKWAGAWSAIKLEAEMRNALPISKERYYEIVRRCGLVELDYDQNKDEINSNLTGSFLFMRFAGYLESEPDESIASPETAEHMVRYWYAGYSQIESKEAYKYLAKIKKIYFRNIRENIRF